MSRLGCMLYSRTQLFQTLKGSRNWFDIARVVIPEHLSISIKLKGTAKNVSCSGGTLYPLFDIAEFYCSQKPSFTGHFISNSLAKGIQTSFLHLSFYTGAKRNSKERLHPCITDPAKCGLAKLYTGLVKKALQIC